MAWPVNVRVYAFTIAPCLFATSCVVSMTSDTSDHPAFANEGSGGQLAAESGGSSGQASTSEARATGGSGAQAAGGTSTSVGDAGGATTNGTASTAGSAGLAGSTNTAGSSGSAGASGASLIAGAAGASYGNPTYTVRIRGATISPFDDRGDAWDLTGTASDAQVAALRAAQSDYAASNRWVQSESANWDPPEVYGDARLSIGGYPEWDVVLQSADLADSTFLPQWPTSGWKHVRLVDSLRILVSLYDKDFSTPDAISYVLLRASDLKAVVSAGTSAALPVFDRTAGRVSWLELEVKPEVDADGAYAPTGLLGKNVLREPKLEVLNGKRSTLWVHGLNFLGGDSVVLDWGDTSYWTKHGATPTGPSPVAVNYHARAYLGVSNVVVRYALDRYCLGSNSCVVACHSAGCAQFGYALATFGALGTRWNVEREIGGGSAAGGSEIAGELAGTGLAGFLGYDLDVARMRSMFDHDALGVQVDLAVGANGSSSPTSLLGTAISLVGEDDGAVAYHSSGGARQALAYCNVDGLFCDAVLPVNSFDTTALFIGHRVIFRDDGEIVDHAGTKKKVADWVAQEFPSP